MTTPLERLRALAYDPDVTPAQICRAARGGDALTKAYAAELLRRVRWPPAVLPREEHCDGGGYRVGDGYGAGDGSSDGDGLGTGDGYSNGNGYSNGDGFGTGNGYGGYGDGFDSVSPANLGQEELRQAEIDYLVECLIADEEM